MASDFPPSEHRAKLLSAAKDIGPVLKERADWAEEHGRLHEDSVHALVEAGIPRLFLPEAFDGLQVDPETCALVCEELAMWDTAAAWFVMVYNAARLMSANWPRDMVSAIWADAPDTLVAASGHTPFAGVACDEGFMVSGQNSFVSGVHHAQYVMSPMAVDSSLQSQGQTQMYVAVLEAGQVTIEDNWDTLGMRGTGSNDVTVEGVFLPRHLAAPMLEAGQSENVEDRGDAALAREELFTSRLYRCPARVVFATYVPVALALARRALSELDDLAQNKVPYATDQRLKARFQAQMHYGRGLAKYRAVREYFLGALRSVWAQADEGKVFSVAERADLYLAGTHTLQTCAEVVRHVADAAGTSVLTRGQPLERILRDMETLKHHGFASENRYASSVQALWDAPLDYPLVLR